MLKINKSELKKIKETLITQVTNALFDKNRIQLETA